MYVLAGHFFWLTIFVVYDEYMLIRFSSHNMYVFFIYRMLYEFSRREPG